MVFDLYKKKQKKIVIKVNVFHIRYAHCSHGPSNTVQNIRLLLSNRHHNNLKLN